VSRKDPDSSDLLKHNKNPSKARPESATKCKQNEQRRAAETNKA
jgi:hypothetical protein